MLAPNRKYSCKHLNLHAKCILFTLKCNIINTTLHFLKINTLFLVFQYIHYVQNMPKYFFTIHTVTRCIDQLSNLQVCVSNQNIRKVFRSLNSAGYVRHKYCSEATDNLLASSQFTICKRSFQQTRLDIYRCRQPSDN